jgi:CBS domain-containing protein
MAEAVVAIEADRPVSEALDCFAQYPIHHLPVVRRGQLAGMLSSADIAKLEHFVPKSAVDRAAWLNERVTIAQLMRNPVVSLKATATLGDAAERLIEAGVHAVPVVDDADHVIGIVSTTDIIRSLLHGPPRRGEVPPLRIVQRTESEDDREEPHYHRKPSREEYLTALRSADALHVEERDPRHLGKTLLYLDQRRRYLEKVLELADRFLVTGQNEHTHALLLKAIHAAKRAEESATGQARSSLPPG